jgi:hypothetical protein
LYHFEKDYNKMDENNDLIKSALLQRKI